MLTDTVSTYFMTQLRFIPIPEMRFSKNFVRDLYSSLAKPGGHVYENLSIQSNPPRMSTNRTTAKGDGVSACLIGSDSITIEETESELHLDQFVEIVETILSIVRSVKEKTAPIFCQKCVFRCLATPKSENSISLLAGKVSNVLKAIVPFERPPLFFGVRFRFPPVEIRHEGATEVEKKQDFASVRFETWEKDVKQVWIEVDDSYFFSEPIAIADIGKISHNMKEAHQFLTKKCVNFLNQFDDMPEPKDDESTGPE